MAVRKMTTKAPPATGNSRHSSPDATASVAETAVPDVGVGLVDWALPPAEIPAQLIAYSAHAVGRLPALVANPAPKIEALDDYVKFLQRTPCEVDALFRDLLIGVPAFVSDPEAFSATTAAARLPPRNGFVQPPPSRRQIDAIRYNQPQGSKLL